jgi:hypothetical protein
VPGIGSWGQEKKLFATDGLAGDSYGLSVAVDGNWMAIGAPGAGTGANDNKGAAYVYYRNQGGVENWGLVQKLEASDGENGGLFGITVSIHSEQIAVGASGWDIILNPDIGGVFFFTAIMGMVHFRTEIYPNGSRFSVSMS